MQARYPMVVSSLPRSTAPSASARPQEVASESIDLSDIGELPSIIARVGSMVASYPTGFASSSDAVHAPTVNPTDGGDLNIGGQGWRDSMLRPASKQSRVAGQDPDLLAWENGYSFCRPPATTTAVVGSAAVLQPDAVVNQPVGRIIAIKSALNDRTRQTEEASTPDLTPPATPTRVQQSHQDTEKEPPGQGHNNNNNNNNNYVSHSHENHEQQQQQRQDFVLRQHFAEADREPKSVSLRLHFNRRKRLYEVPVTIGGYMIPLELCTTRRTITVAVSDARDLGIVFDERSDLVMSVPDKMCDIFSCRVVLLDVRQADQPEFVEASMPRVEVHLSWDSEATSRLGLLAGRRPNHACLHMAHDAFTLDLTSREACLHFENRPWREIMKTGGCAGRVCSSRGSLLPIVCSLPDTAVPTAIDLVRERLSHEDPSRGSGKSKGKGRDSHYHHQRRGRNAIPSPRRDRWAPVCAVREGLALALAPNRRDIEEARKGKRRRGGGWGSTVFGAPLTSWWKAAFDGEKMPIALPMLGVEFGSAYCSFAQGEAAAIIVMERRETYLPASLFADMMDSIAECAGRRIFGDDGERSSSFVPDPMPALDICLGPANDWRRGADHSSSSSSSESAGSTFWMRLLPEDYIEQDLSTGRWHCLLRPYAEVPGSAVCVVLGNCALRRLAITVSYEEGMVLLRTASSKRGKYGPTSHMTAYQHQQDRRRQQHRHW